MNPPTYPVYVISKGRYDTQLTSHMLSRMGVPHFVVIERAELELYGANRTKHARFLLLPPEYRLAYDPCDDLPLEAPRGSGPARNFVWDHAEASGVARYWIMDDNIREVYRHHRNRQIRMGDGSAFRSIEVFADRYENIGLAGPQYFMFVARKSKYPPYVLNTRLYSCILIRTKLLDKDGQQIRWRARYNEDVDLSLRVLKAGVATIQVNAFLQWKMPTMTVAGGNLHTIYTATADDAGGTKAKSEMIVKLHPDVASGPVWKFSRWHHEVDYSRFRDNPLVRKKGLVLPEDGFGQLVLERRDPQLGVWVPFDMDQLAESETVQMGMGLL